MEREFICDGPEDEPHERTATVVIARIGTSPDAPACPTCGRDMRRVYEPTAVKYHPTWEQGRKFV